MATLRLVLALALVAFSAAQSPCLKKSHPYDHDFHAGGRSSFNGWGGWDNSLGLTICIGFFFLLVILGKVIFEFCIRRETKPYLFFFPNDKIIGLRPVNILGGKLHVSILAQIMIVIWAILDMWFRCAAMAPLDTIPWTERDGFSKGWSEVFDWALVNLYHWQMFVAFFVTVLVLSIFVLIFGRNREGVLMPDSPVLPLSVMPERPVSSGGRSRADEGKMPPDGPFKRRGSCLQKTGIIVARLMQGPLWTPILYLLLDPFICYWSEDEGLETEKSYSTEDCAEQSQCFEDGHQFLLAVGMLMMAMMYLLWVLPVRQALNRATFLELGIPHLLFGTITMRVILAWSAKIFRFMSPCGHVIVTVFGNMFLTGYIALALDSMRLKMHIATTVMIALTEVWVTVYNLMGAIIYSLEEDSPCGWIAMVLAFAGLCYLAVLLVLRNPRVPPAPKAPEITQHPADAEVRLGDPVTLKCRAKGKKPLQYQWRRDGTNIPGATENDLELPAVNEADLNRYDCVVTAGNGMDMASDLAHITRKPEPPIFEEVPASQISHPGTDCVLRSRAVGYPEPTYQWYKEGEPIEDATEPTLALRNVRDRDYAHYRCVATNPAGTAETEEVVVSKGDPQFDLHPENTSAPLHGELHLKAHAIGEPEPSYQWYKDGTPIPGAIGPEYLKAPVTPADEGRYHCVASNPAGTADSEPADFVLGASLELLDDGERDLAAAPGEPLRLSARADGQPPPTYQWYKNGEPIDGATNPDLDLGSLGPEDVGVYQCYVSNPAGTKKTQEFHVSLSNVRPYFTDHPQDTTVAGGSTGKLVARAAGWPAPTYQWYKNGAPIEGATQEELEIDNFDPDDEAVYMCRASNEVDEVDSETARLRMTSSGPAVLEEPEDCVEPLGEPGALRCAFSGHPPPTYQWYKDDVPIAGETAPEMKLPEVTPETEGWYTCKATSPEGEVETKRVQVRIKPEPPVFTTQPEPMACVPGDPANMEGIAKGYPPPTYQWYKDDAPIPGATERAFRVDEVSTATEGTYRCVAVNEAGRAESDPVEISMAQVPVTVVDQPEDVEELMSAPGVLHCRGSGHPPPTYQWYKDGVPIDGATSPDFKIGEVTPETEGMYHCVMTNPSGSVKTKQVEVRVKRTPPTFTEEPEAVTAGLGTNVDLIGAADGYPTPVYQWYKDGDIIPGATDRGIRIESISPETEGWYTCKATNSEGSAECAPVQVAITHEEPAIVEHPEPLRADPGGDGELVCRATGFPDPTYQWFKDGEPIPGATSRGLRLDNITEASEGKYTCRASNDAGYMDSRPAMVEMNRFAPEFELEPQVEGDSAPGSPVTLRAAGKGYPPPTYQWYKDGVPIAGATDASFTLPELSPETEGVYQCVISNAAGSTKSKPVELRMAREAPRFVDHPQDQQLFLGEDIKLHAEAEGIPTPSLQWYKFDVPIEGATGQDLLLKNVTKADIDTYVCKATNSEGMVESHEARVTSKTIPPKFPEPIRVEGGVLVGGSAELFAEPTGTAPMKYQWYMNDKKIRGAKDNTLVLKPVRKEHLQATFKLTAENLAGKDDIDTVLEPSSVDIDPFMSRTEPWEIELGWDLPKNLQGVPMEYRVTAQEWDDDPSDDKPERFKFALDKEAPRRFVFDTFHGEPINPGEAYQFVVQARPAGEYKTDDDGWIGADPVKLGWDDPEIKILRAKTDDVKERVVLLRGRYPRIFMLHPFAFDTNRSRIKKESLVDVPLLAEVCHEHPDIKLHIMGHVNFGQRPPDAMKLSTARALEVRKKLIGAKVDESRMTSQGYGYERPRYPKGSKRAFKNRRVEFRVLTDAGSYDVTVD